MEGRETFHGMALGAGELGVGADESVDDMRMLERFEILFIPRDQIDQGIVGAIMFRMALRAFRLFGFGQIVMIALVLGQLLLDFDVALQASRIQALGGVALFAVENKGASGHQVECRVRSDQGKEMPGLP